jgi:HK97 family phage portal protein
MFVTRLQASATPADRGPGSDFWFMPLTARTASGVRVDAKAAMALTAVYASVKVLAESFAVMPFELFRNDPNGRTRTKERNHWLYRLFARRPNRYQNPFEWRLMIQGHLALRGNAYNQITSNNRGEITELLPLHPDRMVVEMVGDGEDYRYVYTDQNGVKHYYSRGEIWHLRGMSDDGIMGISPIEAAREAIGEGLAMQSYSARFFGNDARPPGWIEYPGQFKDIEAKRKWRDSWQQLQGGVNRGKVGVLERGMKYHELGLKNTDTQFIEGRQLKVADVARIFRIPAHKIGDLSRATNNNIEHQSIEFWTDTMLPHTELWEASIEYQLLGQGLPGADEDLEPEFNMDRMMRGDSSARASYYASRIQWGTMTLNEPREREGEEPLPWLDHTMRPVNMIRVDETGEHMHSQPVPADSGVQPANNRRENARAAGAAMASRWRAVITSNAQRMARRLAAGQATSAELLAEALSIQADQAGAWLQATPMGLAEDEYTTALVELAMKDEEA